MDNMDISTNTNLPKATHNVTHTCEKNKYQTWHQGPYVVMVVGTGKILVIYTQ